MYCFPSVHLINNVWKDIIRPWKYPASHQNLYLRFSIHLWFKPKPTFVWWVQNSNFPTTPLPPCFSVGILPQGKIFFLPFFCTYLFNYKYIFTDSFFFFSGLQLIAIHISFAAQIFPALASRSSFKLVPVSFWQVPIIFLWQLLYFLAEMFQVILYFHCFSPGIIHFSQKL